MNKLILISGVVGALLTHACAQTDAKKDVPSAVKTAFTSTFPNAKHIEWSMESENEWEAEFKLGKIEYSANYSTEGKWLETEYHLRVSDIPSTIKTVLESDFADYKIEEVEVAEKISGTFYEIVVEKGSDEIELIFDKTGKLIKRVEITENEDED